MVSAGTLILTLVRLCSTSKYCEVPTSPFSLSSEYFGKYYTVFHVTLHISHYATSLWYCHADYQGK